MDWVLFSLILLVGIAIIYSIKKKPVIQEFSEKKITPLASGKFTSPRTVEENEILLRKVLYEKRMNGTPDSLLIKKYHFTKATLLQYATKEQAEEWISLNDKCKTTYIKNRSAKSSYKR